MQEPREVKTQAGSTGGKKQKKNKQHYHRNTAKLEAAQRITNTPETTVKDIENRIDKSERNKLERKKTFKSWRKFSLEASKEHST